MTPELWQRLKPLYSAALDLPEQGRTGYIEQMCGNEPELARELQALLAANASAANTLDPPLSEISHFLNNRPAVLPPGSVLIQRFRILRHLGSGGMGDVYEAEDLQMERGRIALKTIRPSIAEDAAALARFKDEVRVARKITGLNVCRIYELYLNGSPTEVHGPAFLTMELLEGVTLHERVAESGPLPVAELCAITEQLCAALCCIHEAGIVHRDLKPRNVMLVSHHGAERAVVMDFGLALAADPAAGPLGMSLQTPSQIAGTPSYMAPEQFEGGEVGPATDLYALGLLLYELATGIQPFAAPSLLAAAIRRGKRPRRASTVRTALPPVWDEIIARCLQYDPEHRFQSAGEVLTALKHPKTFTLRLGKNRRIALSRRSVAIASVLAVLLFGTIAWLLANKARQRRLSPDVATWNAQGMTALREGSYLKATHLLEMVTKRDPGYPVAHAALADAWTELDFTDAAQREMLRASSPGAERGLSEPDKQYIDAVRNTLVHDYTAAARDYEDILAELPQENKAQGYVNLGRAYERAGRMRETMDAYEKAAALNPDDPAPFLHLGILRSRLRQTDQAKKAFAAAEALYRAESNLEGLAEVSYQRAHAASENARYKEATQYLDQSLGVAREIPSVQLEVRTLLQLSTVAYRENKNDLAIAYANRAIQTADENGLEYWSTDGMIRLATAYLSKEDYASAEPILQQAMRKARQNGHPRLNALAELTLASLCNLQKRWDEQISLAQSALKYDQDYGFLNQADQAETLILRGERDKGNFEGALQAGDELLRIANGTDSPFYVAVAEELVGGALLRLERYPEALAHFEQGVRELQSLGQDPGYLQLHVADALVQLGRLTEAETVLAAISPEMRKRVDIGSSAAVTRARIESAQGHSRAALSVVQQAWQQYPELRSDPGELDRIALLAEGQQGQMEKARIGAAQLAAKAYAQSRGDAAARAELVQANLALMAGDGLEAERHAQAAEQFFRTKHMLESQALSLLAEAEAARSIGDSARAAVLSQKSVDIFHQLEQSWGVPLFEVYASRPDRRKSLLELSQLRAETGEISHELIP